MARTPVTDADIGALVREWRKRRNRSQPELGAAPGVEVTEQMIQKYETGKSALTVVRLSAIAIFLRCKIADLIP